MEEKQQITRKKNWEKIERNKSIWKNEIWKDCTIII